MSLQHIDVLSVPVTDQDRAKNFYAALGFETVMDYPTGPATRWVQIALPNTQTSLALVTKAQTLPAGMTLGEPGSFQGTTLSTDDLDDAKKQLSGVGAECQIEEASWGRFLVFADPDGNRWLIHETQKIISASSASSPSGPATHRL